jgi:hypothetical protein
LAKAMRRNFIPQVQVQILPPQPNITLTQLLTRSQLISLWPFLLLFLDYCPQSDDTPHTFILV